MYWRYMKYDFWYENSSKTQFRKCRKKFCTLHEVSCNSFRAFPFAHGKFHYVSIAHWIELIVPVRTVPNMLSSLNSVMRYSWIPLLTPASPSGGNNFKMLVSRSFWYRWNRHRSLNLNMVLVIIKNSKKTFTMAYHILQLFFWKRNKPSW